MLLTKILKSLPYLSRIWSNFGEKECQILRHGVRLVRSWEQPVGLQAPVLVVLLDREHLVVARGNACCVGVPLSWEGIFQRRNLMVGFLTEEKNKARERHTGRTPPQTKPFSKNV